MRASKGWDPEVPLPPELTTGQIRRAVEYIEKELNELVEIYYEQANVFSALVGIFGVRALNAFSPYEKHRHQDLAQQRFPDLRHRKSKLPPPPNFSLESKGSKRPWDLQSHYDHPGWYIVWRYLVDETGMMVPGKQIAIWRVDVVFLAKENWKYEGSTASASGGGRTHTFRVKNAAKVLKDKSVFMHPQVVLKGGKPTPRNGD